MILFQISFAMNAFTANMVKRKVVDLVCSFVLSLPQVVQAISTARFYQFDLMFFIMYNVALFEPMYTNVLFKYVTCN